MKTSKHSGTSGKTALLHRALMLFLATSTPLVLAMEYRPGPAPCGIRTPFFSVGSGRSPALIGGKVAELGQYPATIQINRGPETGTKCTAIAISERHVLLA